MHSHGNNMIIDAKKIIQFLLYFTVFLFVGHLTGQILRYEFGYPHIFGLVRLFDFNAEQNLPTLFSTILLIINGVLFFILGKSVSSETRNKWIWYFFAFVFFFLALDEFSEIHESLSKPFHELFNTKGILYYAWVIPYGLLFLLLVLFFVPLWWRMELRIRILFALSAFLYVLGAIGFEMLGGKEFQKMGDQLTLKCSLLATAEEILEIGGLILLFYVLLTLISKERKEFIFKITS